MKNRQLAVIAIALSMSGIAYAANDTGMSSSSSLSSTTSTSAATMDANTIRQVQQALKDAGYDPGTIDGQMGPKTKGALNNFQQSKGITKTASLDSATLSALGVQGQASTSTPSATTNTSTGTSTSPSTSSAPSDTTK